MFDAIEDDYFRERRSDVDFVGERILRNLLGVDVGPAMPPPGAVVVAHDLSPADTAQLHRASCGAFVTDVGGKTSHTAIMARALEIPAVVGLENITEHVGNGDLRDRRRAARRGDRHPDAGAVARLRGARAAPRSRSCDELLDATATCRPRRTDGARVRLLRQHRAPRGGAERRSSTAPRASACSAPSSCTSIGTDLPQRGGALPCTRAACSSGCSRIPATFRTFDLGGDKLAPFAALGRRGEPGARAALDPPVPARAARCSRRSCAASCARRCTGACASCSR